MKRTIPAALLLTLAALPTAAATAIDDEPGFVVGYMSSFVKSCVKKVHADPPVPSVACACLAALTADRVTKDELVASKGDGDRLAEMHPEIRGFVGLCATATGSLNPPTSPARHPPDTLAHLCGFVRIIP